jgi:hypothetical protein
LSQRQHHRNSWSTGQEKHQKQEIKIRNLSVPFTFLISQSFTLDGAKVLKLLEHPIVIMSVGAQVTVDLERSAY